MHRMSLKQKRKLRQEQKRKKERQKGEIDKKESKNLKAIFKVDYLLYADLTLAI